MNPIKPTDEMSPQEVVSLCLRQCALALNPGTGYLKDLAAELDVHESTLTFWMREGRIPMKSARRLLRRFGARLVDITKVSQTPGAE